MIDVFKDRTALLEKLPLLDQTVVRGRSLVETLLCSGHLCSISTEQPGIRKCSVLRISDIDNST